MKPRKSFLSLCWGAIVVELFVGAAQAISADKDLLITSQEKQALDKLRTAVKDVQAEDFLKEDVNLIRWVRLANSDAGQAEKYFLNNLQWRKENRLENILDEDFGAVTELFPIDIEGEDLSGRPVIIGDAAEWDVRQGVLAGYREMVTRHVLKSIEAQWKKIRNKQKKGEKVTRLQAIINMKGFNLVQHGCLGCIPIYLEFLRNFLYNYPFLADSVIVVNAPGALTALMSSLGIGRFRTAELKLFGNNQEKWESYLKSIISEKELPKYLGGLRETYDF